ncbi:hypothetical protein [Sphingomonas faeni]|uniref:hypothetical protein n=1 Tax=Sphingomonas faeni TaxID=185950 RepID=UPI003351A60C
MGEMKTDALGHSGGDAGLHRDLGNLATEGAEAVSARVAASGGLRSWLIQPRRIGGTTYHGRCVIARVRHVTYQQQSTTHGRSAGVFGLASDGRGFVTGGGGFVDTDHRGVISVVVEDEDARHTTHELPSEMALLEGGILRLDLINDSLVSAANLTGRQDGIVLLGPSAFIGTASFTKLHGVLMFATLLMAGQILSPHPIAGLAMTGAFATLPLLRLRRIRELRHERLELKNYMLEVMS